MAWHDLGNKPINSTVLGITVAGSTATLFAELDSTQLGTKNFVTGQSRLFQVTYIMGGVAATTWQVGTCNSTALNAGADEFFPQTAAGQSAQFVVQHELTANQRIRIRQLSSAASCSAYLSAVALT
jgi:hypothetical protein